MPLTRVAGFAAAGMLPDCCGVAGTPSETTKMAHRNVFMLSLEMLSPEARLRTAEGCRPQTSFGGQHFEGQHEDIPMRHFRSLAGCARHPATVREHARGRKAGYSRERHWRAASSRSHEERGSATVFRSRTALHLRFQPRGGGAVVRTRRGARSRARDGVLGPR